MVNSFSSGKGRLVEPSYGSYVDSWQLPVNSNFGLTDALISGTTTLNTSTLTPSTPFWTLVFQDFDTNATPWQNPLAGQNLRIVVTGSLAYNATVFIPQNFPGMWLIDNQTTGAYTLVVKTTNPSSIGIAPPQGFMSYVFCDGTNVLWADRGNVVANQSQGVPSGTILPFGGPNVPLGYLFCDGAAVSRSVYSSLYLAIGTTWGVGDGLTTFNTPDLQGIFLRGVGGNAAALGQLQSDQLGSHTHSVTDPGHVHGFPDPIYMNRFQSNPLIAGGTTGTTVTQTNSAKTGITIDSTGGNETRPKNKSVLYIIKT